MSFEIVVALISATVAMDSLAVTVMVTVITQRGGQPSAPVAAPFGHGAEVRVVLQVRRDGRFRRVAAKRVPVATVTDRDGDADTIADASYEAGFARRRGVATASGSCSRAAPQLKGPVAMKRFCL